MKRDYRYDLEKTARQMIRVHRVDTLIRLILRTIMKNIKVKHSGIFLYDKYKDEYVIRVSKGKRGIKIPEGFAKIKKDNPLIRYFTDKELSSFGQDFLLYNRINYYLKYSHSKGRSDLVDFLEDLKDQLSLFQAKACIPGFFRNDLIGILFLGAKEASGVFRPEELGFLSVLASDVVMAIRNAWLFEDLNKQLDKNKKLFLNTVIAFATAIEAKDKYTSGHTERVVEYSLIIAKVLSKTDSRISSEFIENLRVAALLHDIGKIGIPEEILNKKGILTGEEKEFIFEHPLIGANILNPIGEFKEIIVGVKYHHERWDGKGYPFGLKGEETPLIAAIIAVADSYDAMTTDRPYKKALSREDALKEIKRNSGKQFNPRVVGAFVEAFEGNKI